VSRRRRARARAVGVMVLDNEGVSKASTDRAMYVRLKVAYDEGHRVITSAAVLAEILRGTSRDTEVHRVLARVGVEPVSESIGRRAGHLIGTAGMSSEHAVDAMVAATAIEAAEQAEATDRAASVLIVTSDMPHLTKLVARRTGVAVAHISKLGNVQ
jgi:predicted nucleic acid-binding protein